MARLAECSCPLLVDPAFGKPWSMYFGSTLIKANVLEAGEECRRLAMPNNRASEMAGKIGRQHWPTMLIITAGAEGMYLYKDCKSIHFPAREVEVRDVCGAGDSVMAAMAVALTNRSTIDEACLFANDVAAQQVKHLGVTMIKGSYKPRDWSVSTDHKTLFPSHR